MASSAATEAIEVRRRGRRRLVGAIAIVALLVVFVPMLLDSEPHREAAEPSMQIPSPDKAPPLPPPRPRPPSPAQPPTPAPPQTTPAQAGAQSPLQGFAVQVGAYRDEKTLSEARAKLAAAGLAHYTERLEGSQGLTRLRAGPFPTREAAEKARAALKGSALDGQVVPLP